MVPRSNKFGIFVIFVLYLAGGGLLWSLGSATVGVAFLGVGLAAGVAFIALPRPEGNEGRLKAIEREVRVTHALVVQLRQDVCECCDRRCSCRHGLTRVIQP